MVADATCATWIEFIKCPPFLPHELLESICSIVEGRIDIEHHEAELSIIAIAEALDIVTWPVTTAIVELDGHIVGKLVDVE